MTNRIPAWKLKQRQGHPLPIKIRLSESRIRSWYEHYQGNVYVAFSGGKDSTVLLYLVRSLYPRVPAVFVDTGLEFPEIRAFVKTIDNVVWIKPKMNFKQVLDKYGYPVVSKEQSQFIQEARTTKSEKLLHTRLYGNRAGRGKISECWKFLLDAPFKISHKCCDVMKKRPSKVYEKETGRKPIIGRMAGEGQLRRQKYLEYGCNAFDAKRPTSDPLGFWTEADIWEYIKTRDVKYSKIYDMGEERTGCMFCLFGIHKDNPNRFQKMFKTHPKIWRFCMDKLGLRGVLNFLGIDSKPEDTLFSKCREVLK